MNILLRSRFSEGFREVPIFRKVGDEGDKADIKMGLGFTYWGPPFH